MEKYHEHLSQKRPKQNRQPFRPRSRQQPASTQEIRNTDCGRTGQCARTKPICKKNEPMLKRTITTLLCISLLMLGACGTSGPKYRNVRPYIEGLVPVQTPSGRWGFVNDRQEWVIQTKYEDTREFQGGKAAVRQNNKWEFINKKGEWL